MSDVQDLERRITAALERIGQAIDKIPSRGKARAAPAFDPDLQETLQAERDANAQLTERLRALKDRDGEQVADYQGKIERLTAQLDAQGLDLQRMRKNVVHLRETLRGLRESQSQGLAEPHLLNKAMLSELEALRATRASETTELDEILAELKPLIGDKQDA